MFHHRVLVAVFLALAWVSGNCPSSLRGQEASESVVQPMPTTEINAEQIGELIGQLDNLGEEGAKIRADATAIYQQALKDLQQAKKFEADAAAYEKQLKLATDTAKPGPELVFPQAGEPRSLSGLSTEQLQEELRDVRAKLDSGRKELTRLREEPNRREVRKTEIAKRLAEVNAELERIRSAPADAAADEAPPLTLAKQTAASVRRLAIENERRALVAEQSFYAASGELITTQMEQMARYVDRLDRRDDVLQATVNDRQLGEAMDLLERTPEDQTPLPPSPNWVAALKDTNFALAKENLELRKGINQDGVKLAQAKKENDAWNADLANTRTTIGPQVEATSKLSQFSGELLREKRTALPDISNLLRTIQANEGLRADLQFKQYSRGEELKLVQEELRRFTDDAGGARTDRDRRLVSFLEKRRDLLTRLVATYRDYNQLLLDLNTTRSQIIDTTREYQDYISARILWIQSATWLSPAYLDSFRDAALWLGQPGNWRNVVLAMWQDLTHYAHWTLGFILLFTPLIYYQRRFRQTITKLGENAGKRGFYRFAPTIETLFLTALISLPWPALVAFIAWRLQWSAQEFVTAFALGLRKMAIGFLGLEFVRQSCRHAGLAEAHFGWPREALQLLRRHLRWYIALSLPLTLISVMLFAQKQEQWNNSLGRVAFLLLMVFTFAFLRRVLRPGSGVFTVFLVYQQDSLTFRLRYVWYTLALMGPVALAILAFVGYYYTAMQLAGRLAASASLLVALLFTSGILLRWVTMNRRRMAMQQARQRLAEAASAVEEGAVVPEDSLPDIGAISEQTRQLLKTFIILAGLTGIWLIWEAVFPALSQLEAIPILGTLGSINLSQVVVVLTIVVVTGILAKNLPGLLELTVLKNLPLDAGARYAATTVAQYAIVIIGIFVGCNVLKIQWQSVQWLIAALGVGLGFGLQEILGNFVSGLILLFERPIRIGDIVTIGDTTGLVSRIRIRATTITDWDRKEYLVPNKDIVTGRLLNWTLSDQVNRIVINVGVAYGSDTERARNLLLEVARAHPFVMNDPPPHAIFDGFGDSTLNLVLRCYLPAIENRLAAIHELHTAIHQRFNEAGIEFAFPQRDLHIRSVPANWPASPGAAHHGAAR